MPWGSLRLRSLRNSAGLKPEMLFIVELESSLLYRLDMSGDFTSRGSAFRIEHHHFPDLGRFPPRLRFQVNSTPNSGDESPIISVCSGREPVSSRIAFAPSGSGFFVAKLLPPYTETKNSRKPSASTMAREGLTGLLESTAI